MVMSVQMQLSGIIRDTVGWEEGRYFVSEVRQGNTNRVFTVTRFGNDLLPEIAVRLRSERGKRTAEELRSEEQLHRFAAEREFAPAIVAFHPDYLITQYRLCGKHPSRDAFVPGTHLMKLLCGHIRTIHCESDTLPHTTDHFKRIRDFAAELRAYPVLIDRRRELLELVDWSVPRAAERFYEREPRIVPSHGDLKVENILYDERFAMLLDFEIAGQGPSVMDLARIDELATLSDEGLLWVLEHTGGYREELEQLKYALYVRRLTAWLFLELQRPKKENEMQRIRTLSHTLAKRLQLE